MLVVQLWTVRCCSQLKNIWWRGWGQHSADLSGDIQSRVQTGTDKIIQQSPAPVQFSLISSEVLLPIFALQEIQILQVRGSLMQLQLEHLIRIPRTNTVRFPFLFPFSCLLFLLLLLLYDLGLDIGGSILALSDWRWILLCEHDREYFFNPFHSTEYSFPSNIIGSTWISLYHPNISFICSTNWYSICFWIFSGRHQRFSNPFLPLSRA